MVLLHRSCMTISKHAMLQSMLTSLRCHQLPLVLWLLLPLHVSMMVSTTLLLLVLKQVILVIQMTLTTNLPLGYVLVQLVLHLMMLHLKHTAMRLMSPMRYRCLPLTPRPRHTIPRGLLCGVTFVVSPDILKMLVFFVAQPSNLNGFNAKSSNTT